MADSKVLSAHSGVARYRFPDDEPPPLGRKLLLLTEGGTAVIGLWSNDGGFIAWSPLPPKPMRVVNEGRASDAKMPPCTTDRFANPCRVTARDPERNV